MRTFVISAIQEKLDGMESDSFAEDIAKELSEREAEKLVPMVKSYLAKTIPEASVLMAAAQKHQTG